ncbi:glycosyltransferase family 2 protein [Duganella sp. BuS-21]|uniref:glycosyltransferase family 2 protein n=1 Tax=Duganella sp. BuS-21 TaxID=2943848 RepID=UPI0035A5C307
MTTALPLVSILLPTHNRPDYAELALRSALAQDYPNLEIIVSDNSDDQLTRERFASYVAADPRIRYYKIDSCPPMDNFQHAYELAGGDFVNFLMDDDLFHPRKISVMMMAMLQHPTVGIVSSARQLITADGQPIPSPEHLKPLTEVDTLIAGRSLGAHLTGGGAGNVLGEPTTVLFRKAAAGPVFGVYQGRQYIVVSDMASWLTILATSDCIYLKDALSFFRVHAEQDQRNQRTQLRGHLEGLSMACDVWEHGLFLPRDQPQREKISQALTQTVSLLLPTYELLRDPMFDHEKIVDTVQRATRIVLS